jgi:CheY-like chemotaxis protein
VGQRPARKVLLVDDEDSLRRVMKDLLEREGYVVEEARDGVQALDQVDRMGPDVIVLDLNLRQRSAGLRARRRRFPHQAVPRPRALGPPRSRTAAAALAALKHKP